MNNKTLIHSSILAAIFIAAVIGVNVMTGYPGATPFISVDPISDKNAGDAFSITGTTNLPAGTEILAQVYPSDFEDRTGTGSGEFFGAVGTVAVEKGSVGSNTWSFQLDTSTFPPRDYRVNVSVFTGKSGPYDVETRGPVNQTAFTIRPGTGAAPSPASGKAVAGGILIDPIRDVPQGRLLEVTGKTNLSAGTPLLVKVIPASFDNETITRDYQNPENAAVIRVVKGDAVNNRFSVSLDTRFLPLSDHIITISEMKDPSAGTGSEPARWTGSAIFNIITGTSGMNSSGNPGTNLSVPSIFINPIDDVSAGDTIFITGTTNVPPGSKFQVGIIPESMGMDNETLQKNIENPKFNTTISAVRGSSNANLFSVEVPTRGFTPGEYIIFVSAYDYETTGSILFTVK
jgi:hypothetical protein